MKLIVGLGNPGEEYSFTRHNIGYMFLDKVCNTDFLLNKKMNSLESICLLNGEKVIFVKPLSYMNLSGSVVLNYVNYYKINLSDILVIQDDLDMSLGRYKVLFNRGDGGHNGIKDIIRCLSSKNFFRLKIGISRNNNVDVKDFVLGKFTKDELLLINDSFNNLDNIINDFIIMNNDSFVQKYNTKVDD